MSAYALANKTVKNKVVIAEKINVNVSSTKH